MMHVLFALITGLLAATCVYTAGRALSRSSGERRIGTVLFGAVQSVPAATTAGSSDQVAEYVVTRLNLHRWLSLDGMREKLNKAGRRGRGTETAFLMSRFALSMGLGGLAWFYVTMLSPDMPTALKMGMVLFAIWAGIKLPEMALDRAAKARQASVRAAWPDALDLMLIMVEAGRPIEQTLRRMADDMAPRSRPLAEEISITLAELAILPERRQAYENFGNRMDLPEVRSTCMAIVQADEQGTSLAQVFRTLADEGRALRLSAAEKKGAKAATYLALPLMLFFIPPLIVIAALPMAIKFMGWG